MTVLNIIRFKINKNYDKTDLFYTINLYHTINNLIKEFNRIIMPTFLIFGDCELYISCETYYFKKIIVSYYCYLRL